MGYMHQFYVVFPNSHALRDELSASKKAAKGATNQTTKQALLFE